MSKSAWSSDIEEVVFLIGSGDTGIFNGKVHVEKVRLAIVAGLIRGRENRVPNSRMVRDDWDIEWFVVLTGDGEQLFQNLRLAA